MVNRFRSRTDLTAPYVAPPIAHRRPSDLPKVNFTYNEWQYLTVDQALEDFVVFAKGFTLPSDSRIKLESADALRPHKTPWVYLGTSYAGVRAALLRIRNPDVVFASWASSAPVQAQTSFTSYFEAVERALPRNCSADWVAVTKYVDDVLMGNNTAEQITVKRALHTAGMSRPDGNTTAAEPLSDSGVLALSSEDAADVLLHPLDQFQVSRSLTVALQWDLPRSSGLAYHMSARSATGWRLKTSQLIPHRKVLTFPREPTLRSTRLLLPSLKLGGLTMAGVPTMRYVFPPFRLFRAP